ncbi:MAG: FecR domain-containing protein [Bacteroidia bacterium]
MNFEDYKDFLANDFACDEDFIRWVSNPHPVDETFWKGFISEYPGSRSEVEEAAEIVRKSRDFFSGITLDRREKSEIHKQLLEKIHTDTQYKALFRPARKFVFRWAAVIILLVACGYSFYWYQGRQRYQEFETAFGETLRLTLPDGSLIRLNAHSTIGYYSNWDIRENRCVWLQGEAFFEVTKKPETQAKFLVHANDLVVQVLGTKFNVNTRKEKTRVVLNEGQIQLTLNSEVEKPIFMIPGDMVDYDPKGNHLIQTKVNAELHSSWKEGIQLFDKTPFPEIIDKMEEIYGITIQLNDKSLKERKMTMGIPVEDLTIALATVESVLGLKIIRIDNKNFVIN